MSNLAVILDADFESAVINSPLPVLVDFWAPWCQPCKALLPLLEEVAGTYADRLKVCKLNVEEQTDIASQYGVRGIPTLMLFKEGKLVATKVGALNVSQLTAFIDSHI